MEATHVQCSISDELIPIEQAVELYNGDIVDRELDEIVEVDGEFFNSEEDDVYYVDSRSEWYHADDCTYSEGMGEWVHNDDGEWDYDEEEFATSEWFMRTITYYIEYGQASGKYLYCEYTSYCEDIGEAYTKMMHTGTSLQDTVTITKTICRVMAKNIYLIITEVLVPKIYLMVQSSR